MGEFACEEEARSEISAIWENPSFPLRAENERPNHPFAFAAGRSLVGQSTFALAHAVEAEFGYRETDRQMKREGQRAREKEWSVKRGRARGKEAVSRACFKSDSSVRADHWLLLINNKCIPE